MKDLVCPLVLALYGHPDAGTCWEQHCDLTLKAAGFAPILGWSGCYRHTKLRAVLTVYVDDFKVAAHQNDIKEVWKLIRSAVLLEDPIPLKQYLGCTHKIHEGQLKKDVRAPGGWLPIEGYKKRDSYPRTTCVAWNST